MIQESMINYLSDILKDTMEFTSSYMKWSEGLFTVVKRTKLIAYVGLMLKSTRVQIKIGLAQVRTRKPNVVSNFSSDLVLSTKSMEPLKTFVHIVCSQVKC